MRPLSLGAAALALALAVAKCAPQPSASAPRPAAYGDRLVYADQIEPDSLNPYLSNTLAATRVEALIFSGLLRYGRGATIEPDLATVVPSRANGGISADGTTFTYHLRRARWHDGVPVTSADVVYTWRAVMDPANPVTTRVGFEEIARMDAPDPLTVRMVFRRPYAPALTIFCIGASASSILPQHVLQSTNFATSPFNGAPVGSGPYAFDRWDRGSSIALHADPHYHLRPPSIARIVYRIVPDTTTLFSAVRTHEVDAGEIEASFVAQLRSDSGIGVAIGPTLGHRHVQYDVARGALRDRRVRLALSYAVDRAAIFRKIYFGIGSTAPGDILPASGWGDPALKPYPHDPARAERLLDAAGYRRGADGIRARGGVRLEFTLCAIAGQRPAEATEVELQADWAKIGVGITVKNAPGVFLFAPTGPLMTGAFDIAYFGLTGNADPDDSNRYASDRVPPAGRNFSRLRDPLLDDLDRRALAATDVAERHRLVARIDDETVASDAVDTIYWIPSIVAHDARIAGIEPAPGTTIFWNVTNWRFKN